MIKPVLMQGVFKVIVAGAAISIFTLSCKKDKTTPDPVVPVMYVPSSTAPFAARMMAAGASASELSIPRSDVWGIFLITRLESGMGDTTHIDQYHYEDWQEVYFCGADGTGFALPANLSINSVAVAPDGDHYFMQGDAWRNNWLNHWEIAAKDSIPRVSANMMDEYPSFNSTLPSSVTRASGFSYTFVPSQIKKADSAYILIHANGDVARSNVVSVKATGGTATISKDKLQNMHNEYFTLDDKVFFGAVLEVVLLKDSIQTFNGKKFAFISQREVVRKIDLK